MHVVRVNEECSPLWWVKTSGASIDDDWWASRGRGSGFAAETTEMNFNEQTQWTRKTKTKVISLTFWMRQLGSNDKHRHTRTHLDESTTSLNVSTINCTNGLMAFQISDGLANSFRFQCVSVRLGSAERVSLWTKPTIDDGASSFDAKMMTLTHTHRHRTTPNHVNGSTWWVLSCLSGLSHGNWYLCNYVAGKHLDLISPTKRR